VDAALSSVPADTAAAAAEAQPDAVTGPAPEDVKWTAVQEVAGLFGINDPNQARLWLTNMLKDYVGSVREKSLGEVDKALDSHENLSRIMGMGEDQKHAIQEMAHDAVRQRAAGNRPLNEVISEVLEIVDKQAGGLVGTAEGNGDVVPQIGIGGLPGTQVQQLHTKAADLEIKLDDDPQTVGEKIAMSAFLPPSQ
jgi:hypothetical protein